MSFLAAFIMRGRMQAILVASLLTWVSPFIHPLIKPFVIIVSFATIALVTLRRGALEGFYILFAATAVAALGALLVGGYDFFIVMLLSCFIMWLPVWLIAIVLREGRRLAWAIECAVFIAVLGVVGFYIYATDPAAIWQEVFAPFLDILPAEVPVEEIRNQVNIVSHYMTGVFAASTLFAVLFSIFLGRWWQSVLYNPDGFKEEFLSIRTGYRLAIASILVIAVAKFTSGLFAEMAWNITILLFVLYLFMGTSVLHTVFSSMKQSKYLVPTFYITMFLIPHAMLPVALVGLFDAWFNLRKIPSASSSKG
ncbi:MAG: hypothetical protein NTW85_05805 [Methylococcales bacterium]|nr:hypothetical protein [Methylococcales bacterium]